jgi:hypothetical protein
MPSVAGFLPFTVVAVALLAACSDVSSTTRPMPVSASALASKGSGSGGGGGGGGGTLLVVTTPPTVSATGTWVGTSDGPDVTHTYTFTLSQTDAGMVSGAGTTVTPFMTASYQVVGTVNGDTLMLYTGMNCSSCALNPLYRGIVSADGSRVDGNFLNGGVSPVTLFKQ